MISLLQDVNPMRDPAWRSNRVSELVDTGPRSKQPDSCDDNDIRTYRKFRMHWKRNDPSIRRQLALEMPGLYLAHWIHGYHDDEHRTILEAKILARLPDDLIAAEMSTIPDAVRWYESLFFNVRDRLHARTYITKMILGPAARRLTDYDDVLTDTMRTLCYKSFAYFGGPLVLDVILVGYSALLSFPRRPDDVPEWFDEAFKATVKARATQTAQVFTVNKFNCMELMQMHVALLAQSEAAKAAGGGVKNEFHRNVEAFFERMPLAMGSKSSEGRPQKFLEYEKSAVEPRASEMLAIAEGTEPEPLRAKVAKHEAVA